MIDTLYEDFDGESKKDSVIEGENKIKEKIEALISEIMRFPNVVRVEVVYDEDLEAMKKFHEEEWKFV